MRSYSRREYVSRVITTVVLDAAVQKALPKLPLNVRAKLLGWVLSVQSDGLENVRKAPGFHDEPLKGKRAGQRSVRLSRTYCALYRIERNAVRVEIVRVFDVNKHDY